MKRSLSIHTDETVTHATIFISGKYPMRQLSIPILLLEDIEMFFPPLKHPVDYWQQGFAEFSNLIF